MYSLTSLYTRALFVIVTLPALLKRLYLPCFTFFPCNFPRFKGKEKEVRASTTATISKSTQSGRYILNRNKQIIIRFLYAKICFNLCYKLHEAYVFLSKFCLFLNFNAENMLRIKQVGSGVLGCIYFLKLYTLFADDQTIGR